jgi:hypothetical protein
LLDRFSNSLLENSKSASASVVTTPNTLRAFNEKVTHASKEQQNETPLKRRRGLGTDDSDDEYCDSSNNRIDALNSEFAFKPYDDENEHTFKKFKACSLE